jgi:transmembrane sensor
VEADPAETRVGVIEGRVAVSPPGPRNSSGGPRAAPLVLSAGDHARIGGGVAGSRSTAPSVIAWTAGRLLLRNAPLGAVIGELDRYQARRLILADSGLATLTISGVFDPTDIGPLLRYLELYQGVRAESAPDGSVNLSAGTLPPR